ncbi:hypothetical protein Bbelb_291960 [Branchiostoma belcheri]|nr:hypothetical protein Bbelb_291960 [Branchiostoma belcheri]
MASPRALGTSVKIITKRNLCRDIRRLSSDHQISYLEVFHALILSFAPKIFHFSYHGMQGRGTRHEPSFRPGSVCTDWVMVTLTHDPCVHIAHVVQDTFPQYLETSNKTKRTQVMSPKHKEIWTDGRAPQLGRSPVAIMIWLELLVKAKTWYCDGTFFVVRPTFTQLLRRLDRPTEVQAGPGRAPGQVGKATRIIPIRIQGHRTLPHNAEKSSLKEQERESIVVEEGYYVGQTGQKEETEDIQESLDVFKVWNHDWMPSHFMVDKSNMEINALKTEFPAMELLEKINNSVFTRDAETEGDRR